VSDKAADNGNVLDAYGKPGESSGGDAREPHAGSPRGSRETRSSSWVFSTQELSRYYGKEGRPAYVAYRGLFSDVSGSFLWRGGRHQALHDAGRDLSLEFEAAPHGTLVLSRVTIVGRLAPQSK
jgi:predicted heme/steroid binding protein